tara:strand:+ start:2689 stop:3081 length:393 start_codon:yes stop_codon:yes gene_type:complete
MKQLNLTYLITPCHGYLKVTKQTFFEDMKFNGGEFSKFSWQSRDGDMLYLEEDCDMPKFIGLAKGKGYDINITERSIGWDIGHTGIELSGQFSDRSIHSKSSVFSLKARDVHSQRDEIEAERIWKAIKAD